MAQKERINQLRLVLAYFIRTNYPVQNALLTLQDEDHISDQRERIYDNLMSDESLYVEDTHDRSQRAKSQRCLALSWNERELGQRGDTHTPSKPGSFNQCLRASACPSPSFDPSPAKRSSGQLPRNKPTRCSKKTRSRIRADNATKIRAGSDCSGCPAAGYACT